MRLLFPNTASRQSACSLCHAQSAFSREELEAAAAAAAAAAAERYLQLGVPRERVRVVASREEVEAAGRALAAADAIGVDAEWCGRRTAQAP